jgi:predicted O-methyltransferase YrrM
MTSRIISAARYLHYYVTASNGRGHGIHSPFVFSFIRDVLCNRNKPPVFFQIEQLRGKLLSDKRTIPVTDFGAGSKTGAGNERSISSIAVNAAKSPRYGRLLHRIAAWQQPASILELGTSLGISTAYLATACENAVLHSIEGSPSVAVEAKRNLASLDLRNCTIHTGGFDEQLPLVLSQVRTLDLVFVDGNHRYEPTIRYFDMIIPKLSPYATMIFDDIYWSREMIKAWNAIVGSDMVKTTVDLYQFGIVFFHSNFRVSQHFKLRY